MRFPPCSEETAVCRDHECRAWRSGLRGTRRRARDDQPGGSIELRHAVSRLPSSPRSASSSARVSSSRSTRRSRAATRHDRCAGGDAAASARGARHRDTRGDFRSLFDENPQPMLVTRLPARRPRMATCNFWPSTMPRGDVWLQPRRVPRDSRSRRSARPRIASSCETNLHAMRGGRTHFEGIRHSTKTGGVLDVEIDTRETIFDGETAMIVCPSDVTDRMRLAARARASGVS